MSMMGYQALQGFLSGIVGLSGASAVSCGSYVPPPADADSPWEELPPPDGIRYASRRAAPPLSPNARPATSSAGKSWRAPRPIHASSGNGSVADYSRFAFSGAALSGARDVYGAPSPQQSSHRSRPGAAPPFAHGTTGAALDRPQISLLRSSPDKPPRRSRARNTRREPAVSQAMLPRSMHASPVLPCPQAGPQLPGALFQSGRNGLPFDPADAAGDHYDPPPAARDPCLASADGIFFGGLPRSNNRPAALAKQASGPTPDRTGGAPSPRHAASLSG